MAAEQRDSAASSTLVAVSARLIASAADVVAENRKLREEIEQLKCSAAENRKLREEIDKLKCVLWRMNSAARAMAEKHYDMCKEITKREEEYVVTEDKKHEPSDLSTDAEMKGERTIPCAAAAPVGEEKKEAPVEKEADTKEEKKEAPVENQQEEKEKKEAPELGLVFSIGGGRYWLEVETSRIELQLLIRACETANRWSMSGAQYAHFIKFKNELIALPVPKPDDCKVMAPIYLGSEFLIQRTIARMQKEVSTGHRGCNTVGLYELYELLFKQVRMAVPAYEAEDITQHDPICHTRFVQRVLAEGLPAFASNLTQETNDYHYAIASVIERIDQMHVERYGTYLDGSRLMTIAT